MNRCTTQKPKAFEATLIMKRKKCAGVFLSGAEASFIYWRERHDLKFVPFPSHFMR